MGKQDYVYVGGYALMSCTLCWAVISIENLIVHTHWHENVERVPALTTDYPPNIVIPKTED